MCWIGKERKKQMAQRTLMVTNSNQLHKCHLQEGTPNELTVGSDWSCDITFFELDREVSVKWDEDECYIDDQTLTENKPLTVKGERPLSSHSQMLTNLK